MTFPQVAPLPIAPTGGGGVWVPPPGVGAVGIKTVFLVFGGIAENHEELVAGFQLD